MFEELASTIIVNSVLYEFKISLTNDRMLNKFKDRNQILEDHTVQTRLNVQDVWIFIQKLVTVVQKNHTFHNTFLR